MGKRLLDQMLIFSSLSAFQCFHIMILGLNSADNITALYGLHFDEWSAPSQLKGLTQRTSK
uniref:Uncharacterized protein n=1 Tax=Chelonoidis abingdonii TaxID=106734 RepID=A0A8C0H097_CHEAB